MQAQGNPSRAVARDLAAREQDPAQPPAVPEQLQSLTRRLVDAQEAERRKVSRELHDLIGQNLTVLNINLDIVRSELPEAGSAKVRQRLAEMRALVETTLDSVRSVMAELQPAALAECGLAATLHQYASRFRERTGCHVNVSAEACGPRPSRDAELALFRIVQEALTNVARHSESRYARVALRPTPDGVVLTVQDYGRGFALGAERRTRARGWGLMIMRERALAAGGRLWIESEPGAGTRVIVEVPAGPEGPPC